MRIVRIILMSSFTFLAQFSYATSVNYVVDGFDAAKNRAQVEGKMLLVDFYATWCVPCQWMDETTFADPSVIDKMNTDYVSVKVNIDDFDGYALKEHYGVKVLPTVIIIDNNGKVVERVEETIPPTKMSDILDRNKTDHENIVHIPNTNPETLAFGTQDELEYKPTGVRYKLQLGTFTNYAATLKYYQNVSAVLEDQIIILHDYKGGNIIYRVLMGNFNNTTEAEIYKTELLEEHNINSNLYY